MAQGQMQRTPQVGVPERTAQANLFDFTGPIAINYSRSSIAAQALFSYRDAEFSLSFHADEVTRVTSSMGELVTITLQDAVDAFVRTFTLVVPEIRMHQGDALEFDAFGIETIDCSGAFGRPPGPVGNLQASRFHQLHGTAQLVEP